MDNKLELLYDIEGSLAVLELRIPYGLRKSSQVSRAVYCVGQLIEAEIKEQVERGNTDILTGFENSKLVTKHTRAKKDGTLLLCPECKETNIVYHFSWTTLVCLDCRASVNKYDWRLADD